MSLYSPFDDLNRRYTGEDAYAGPPICREAYVDAVDGNHVEAQRWYASGFNPLDVCRFVAMGLTVEEAMSWGLNASMVQRFRALGFTKSEARAWALAGIWPDHAVHWRRRGIKPHQACDIINHTGSATEALGWTLVDAQPSDLAVRASLGEKPGRLLAEQASTTPSANV